jgi:hypothetical protein
MTRQKLKPKKHYRALCSLPGVQFDPDLIKPSIEIYDRRLRGRYANGHRPNLLKGTRYSWDNPPRHVHFGRAAEQEARRNSGSFYSDRDFRQYQAANVPSMQDSESQEGFENMPGYETYDWILKDLPSVRISELEEEGTMEILLRQDGSLQGVSYDPYRDEYLRPY